MVEYIDGSLISQMSKPDMKIPIAYALSYPQRLPLQLNRLGLSQCDHLQFEEPDYQRFPALQLSFEALKKGGTTPAVLNGANEEAVEAFLNNRIAFPRIAEVVAESMARVNGGDENNLENILEADREARKVACELIDGKTSS